MACRASARSGGTHGSIDFFRSNERKWARASVSPARKPLWRFSGSDGRMKSKDLRPESKVDTIELTIASKSEVREFTSRSGATGKVCDCKAQDADGDEVQVTLWNEEIDRVKVNDRVRISNGWVREWRGELQASAGRYGTLEILK